MIIQCKSCQKKFLVSENAIPKEGMEVQCGVCSNTWFQKPEIKKKAKPKFKSEKIMQEASAVAEQQSVDRFPTIPEQASEPSPSRFM